MDWTTIAAGVGAVLTGAGGCVLVIHEFRRRDRAAMRQEVDELSDEVRNLHSDLIAARRYAYGLAQQLAGHGVDVIEPPEPRHRSEP